jgi:hypothetical protein
VTSVTPYVNIPDYPDAEPLLSQLATFDNCILVDGGQIAKAAGNMRAQNMVAVGAASCRLDFTEDQLLTHVEALFTRKGEKIVEVNKRAFAYGRAAGLFFRGLVDGGVPIPSALRVCQKISPDTFDPGVAGDWAAALAGDGEGLENVLAGDEPIRGDRVPTSV